MLGFDLRPRNSRPRWVQNCSRDRALRHLRESRCQPKENEKETDSQKALEEMHGASRHLAFSWKRVDKLQSLLSRQHLAGPGSLSGSGLQPEGQGCADQGSATGIDSLACDSCTSV